MDINPLPLDAYAFNLWQAVDSIKDLEDFSHHIVPDDNADAYIFICSLQNIQSKLQWWASSYPAQSVAQNQPLELSDLLLYPTAPEAPEAPAFETYCTLQSYASTLITEAPSPLTTATTVSYTSPSISDIADLATVQPELFTREPKPDIPSSWLDQSDHRQGGSPPLYSQESFYQRSSTSPILSFIPPSRSPLGNTEFVLESSAAESNLLSYLTDITKKDTFNNLIHIKNIPLVSWDTITAPNEYLIKNYSRRVTYRSKCAQAAGRFTHLVEDNDTYKFQYPPDDAMDEQPSDELSKAFLESLVMEASQEPSVPYYMGPPLDERWNGLVNGGAGLKSQIPGNTDNLASPHWHLGGRLSGTAFQKEDCDLRSMNLVIYGWKVCLIVDTQDTERFEAWVKNISSKNAGHDDQWLKHLGLILPPSMLKAANIKFHIICAGPGDMVIINPNQYYYMVNMTSSLVITVNFLFPNELIANRQTLLCEDCGAYCLAGKVANLEATLDSNGSAGSAQLKLSSLHTRRRVGLRQGNVGLNGNDGISDGEVDEEHVQRRSIIEQLQAQPAGCLVPAFSHMNPPKAKILRLSIAMRSPRTISQIWNLWQSFRDRPSAELNMALIDRRLTGTEQQMALDKGISICNHLNQYSGLLRRLLTWHFAEEVERSKSPTAMRVSSAVVNQYATNSTKSRYNRIKYRGDLLHMICGSHRGLLAFIPLQRDDSCGISDPEGQYQYSATKKDFMEFSKIFEVNDASTNVLCAIGTGFLDSCCYKDQSDFKYDDWLCDLYRDLSSESIQSMASQLGEGVCGCIR